MDISIAIQIALEHFYMFHRFPELSGEEYETTTEIKRVLEEHNIEIYPLNLKTGLVAKIEGSKPGPVIALRCDIDALPLEEKTDLTYKSQKPGIMHACGHDFHASTLLGIALALKANPPACGTVKLIFQPSEERLGGAEQVIETGILKDVQAIFGFHCYAAYERGTIICRSGAMHGSVDCLKLTFKGKGAHACRPFLAIEPILMLSQFTLAAQTLISRGINPFHSAVFSICHLQSGTCANIIPEEGVVEGTLRTIHPQDRSLLKEKIFKLAVSIAEYYGGEVDCEWQSGPPSTNNNEAWVAFIKNIAGKQKLPFAVAPDSLAGEDFAYYQENIPGAFIEIGTGIGPMMHNPTFKLDPLTLEDSIPFGVKLALEALEKLQRGG